MPKLSVTLTAGQVARITAEGRHAVSPNLYLRISGQRRTFEARITRNGRRIWLKVGDARHMRIQDARRAVEDVITAEDAPPSAGVFADAAEQYLKTNSAGWNAVHQRQWRQTLDDYILPAIGNMSIAAIRPSDVANLLSPIWIPKNETARRIRGRIENVIDYAHASAGILALNPAALKLVGKLLPKVALSDNHHPAPSVDELRALLHGLGDFASHRCLAFTTLTAARTSEARQAVWAEIDGDVWTVSAERMKTNKPHRVPLSPAALKVIGKRGAPDELLFGELSLNAMRQLLVDRGAKWTVHGIRSTFRDWCAATGVDADLAELSLSHAVGGKVQRAYQRGDLLERRAEVMKKWARVLR
jgi:integrase